MRQRCRTCCSPRPMPPRAWPPSPSGARRPGSRTDLLPRVLRILAPSERERGASETGLREDGADGGVDVVLGDEDEVGGVAERDERVGGGDATDRAVEAGSTSPAMTASPTPPDWRVSSTTSTRPTARAWRGTSSIGSGASQRRSRTRHRSTPSAAAAARRRAATGAARWPTSRRARRRRRGPPTADPIGTCVVAHRSGGAYGAVQRRRPARTGRGCGTARSARGTRSPCRRRPPRPRRCAASAARRRGWAGEAMTSPGMSRSTATALSLWKWPPNPFW